MDYTVSHKSNAMAFLFCPYPTRCGLIALNNSRSFDSKSRTICRFAPLYTVEACNLVLRLQPLDTLLDRDPRILHKDATVSWEINILFGMTIAKKWREFTSTCK